MMTGSLIFMTLGSFSENKGLGGNGVLGGGEVLTEDGDGRGDDLHELRLVYAPLPQQVLPQQLHVRHQPAPALG